MGLSFQDSGQADRLTRGYVALDVETTGLSPSSDRIVEIAVIRLSPSGTLVDEWTSRLDPEGPVGPTHIHGLTQADVDGRPLFSSIAPQVADLLGGRPVVAHNARFDLAFLRNEFDRAGWDMPWLHSFCTLDASFEYLPELDRRRLIDCCWAAGVQHENPHSAADDARATAALFAHYLERDPELPQRLDLNAEVTWPSSPTRDPADWKPAAPLRAHRWTPSRPVGTPLMTQLSVLTLGEVLDEGAPVGSLGYLETLFTALEDGELNSTEIEHLAGLADAYELSGEALDAIHQAFVLALAHRALDDGHVSRSEREELHHVAAMIGVPKDVVPRVIARADAARAARMSEGLRELPSDWPYGEPLCVGEKVVFTGCIESERIRLEERAERLGVRVVGAVSRQTAMLVTDGSFHGNKAAKAAELSIRVVHPDEFEVLLTHLQPAVSPPQVRQGHVTPEVGSSEVVPHPSISTQSGARGASPSVVRAWAIANGIEVGARGRLHSDVFDAYWSAQG